MRLLLCLLALPLAFPAAAQEVEVPIPAPAVLERMCSPAGAMQFAFGQTGVPGSSKLEVTLRSGGFRLPAALAPFRSAQPRSTEWSARFMEMTYSAPLPPGDAAGADALKARIAAALAAAGWERIPLSAEDAPLYLMAYGSDTVLARPAGEGTPPGRVLLSLDFDRDRLTMTCGRDDLLRAHAEEAFGKLPPGTPRPVVPTIAIPATASPADCDRSEVQAQTAALLAEGITDRFMADMLARTTWRDRLTTWMVWKLRESGKVSSDRLIRLTLSATGKASPGGDPFAALAMIEEMFPLLKTLGEAEKSGDATALCRAMIPFQAWITKVDAITLKQTEGAQAALAAEAKRLGVSLD